VYRACDWLMVQTFSLWIRPNLSQPNFSLARLTIALFSGRMDLQIASVSTSLSATRLWIINCTIFDARLEGGRLGNGYKEHKLAWSDRPSRFGKLCFSHTSFSGSNTLVKYEADTCAHSWKFALSNSQKRSFLSSRKTTSGLHFLKG